MKSDRKHIRFEPDNNALIHIHVNDQNFTGLALTEAYKGCSGVFILNDVLKSDLEVSLKIGDIQIKRAIIRWTKMVNDKLLEAGFEYLD